MHTRRAPAGNRSDYGPARAIGRQHRDERPSKTERPRDDRQLLDKSHVEKMTSLDITTIYWKIKAGTFPHPVKVGRRRVAWRTSDIMRWQDLHVGTENAAWMRAGRAEGIQGQEAEVAVGVAEPSAATQPTVRRM
jgi:prophage regulatory protein